ncbi:MAG TPA: sulfatase-like hydrolase/transferase [Pedobacter sp.]|jgi:phosphoglycerol transferase MdoB-like AlkP superfamily enzyme
MSFQINRFLNNNFKLFKVYLFFLAIFTLFRTWFLIRLGDSSLFLLPGDVSMAFLRGLQYDTMVICYLLIIPFLIYFVDLFLSKDNFLIKCGPFIKWYCLTVLALALVVLFIDQYYYNYFQTHISVIIFGLADDDSQTVMSSVWADYPIFRLAIVWIGTLIGFHYYFRKLSTSQELHFSLPKIAKPISIATVAALYLVGLRGTAGTLPLEMHDSQVSENKFVNFLTVNGIYAFKQSYNERKKSENVIENHLEQLRELGYQSPVAAAQDYFAGESTGQISQSEAFEKLFKTTPKNPLLEKNRPNVVFVFMESMSNYNMNFDSKQMNLLGSLRKHVQSDIVFRNFVSSGNITIQSLEYLMVNSPVSLSQTKYRSAELPSSVAIPFKNSGYETGFVTGGKVNWRGMDSFATRQKFDKVKGMADIQKSIKKSQANKWGVYDEYLFDYVFNEISEQKSQPKFFFVQTTTNHTPFELPSNYKPSKIVIPDSLKEVLLVNEELAVKNLNAYQYANNCLGNFLDKIKNSPLGENTIVVVTGDHNNLMLFDFDEAHQLQQRGVPLYLYIPEKYKPTAKVDVTRFGSHKDIFPTIFNLALSNSKYFTLGNNLLETGASNEQFYGVNIGSSTSFSADAAVNFSSSTLYKWNQTTQTKSLTRVPKSEEASTLLKRSKSNYALSMFYILDQIEKTERKPASKNVAQL